MGLLTIVLFFALQVGGVVFVASCLGWVVDSRFEVLAVSGAIAAADLVVVWRMYRK